MQSHASRVILFVSHIAWHGREIEALSDEREQKRQRRKSVSVIACPSTRLPLYERERADQPKVPQRNHKEGMLRYCGDESTL